jgi:hypothetical protein
VLYCLGRLHLHREMFTDALKFFQLGQLAAQESGYELAVALLCANEAWTYALLDQKGQALKSVGRAQAEFARADPVEVPTWIRFFGPADLEALVAMAYAFLPTPTPRQRHESIAGFDRSLAARGPDAARNRAFETTALAMVHLQEGDLDHGAAVGHRAIDLAEQVRSIRVVDRLTPLLVEAQRRRDHSDVADLAERIVTLQAA